MLPTKSVAEWIIRIVCFTRCHLGVDLRVGEPPMFGGLRSLSRVWNRLSDQVTLKKIAKTADTKGFKED